MTELIKKIKEHKKAVIIGAIAILVLAAGVTLFFALRKDQVNPDALLDGSINDRAVQSDEVEKLFYVKEGKFLIAADKIEQVTNLEAIKIPGGYAIKTTKTQVVFPENGKFYRINQNEISGDNTLVAPLKIENSLYIDADVMFFAFGYSTRYEMNESGKSVCAYLTKQGGLIYDNIKAKKNEIIAETERETQIEEQMIFNNEESLDKPSEGLPIVPRPEEKESEPEEYELETIPYQEASGQGMVIKEKETEPETEFHPYVQRTEEASATKSQEEMDTIWSEDKAVLKNIFASGAADIDNPAFKERSENEIAFNPMHGAIYYDTINVTHNPTEKIFVEAVFSGDWSDMADSTDNANSKAYYNGLPKTYQATLKQLLGANEGERLFQYIKSTADVKPEGGYISKHDENGNIISEWSEGPVGDGIKASEIDFADWQNKKTDYGMRYSITRDGDGFRVTVYNR